MFSAKTDIELWDLSILGDHHAFGVLFRRHYSLLYQYGLKICKDHGVVEDNIQELFIELWRTKPDIAMRSLKAYLLQSLKFKLYKTFRNRHTTLEIENIKNESFELSYETFLINAEDDHERSKKILEALNALSPRQKEVIYLKIYKGLNYEEVSEIMQLNYQVTRNLLYQAVRAIRKTVVPLMLIITLLYR